MQVSHGRVRKKSSLTIGKRKEWINLSSLRSKQYRVPLFCSDKIYTKSLPYYIANQFVHLLVVIFFSNFQILLGDYLHPFQFLRGLLSVSSSTWWFYYFGIHIQFLCQDAKLLPEKLRSQIQKNSFDMVTSLMNLNEMYCNVV